MNEINILLFKQILSTVKPSNQPTLSPLPLVVDPKQLPVPHQVQPDPSLQLGLLVEARPERLPRRPALRRRRAARVRARHAVVAEIGRVLRFPPRRL